MLTNFQISIGTCLFKGWYLTERNSAIEHLPSVFFRFLISRAFAAIAVMAYLTFYMWLIIVLYHSVFLSGMIVTIYLSVDILLSFPIGHLIDRHNSTVLNMFSSVLMLSGILLMFTGFSLPLLYFSTGLLVSGFSLKVDSFPAVMKRHLHEVQFKRAVSINYMSVSASSLIGTLAGGLSIIFLSKSFDYAILSLVIVSLVLSWPVDEVSYRSRASDISSRGEMKYIGSFLLRISGFLILAFFINGLFISLNTYSSGLFHLILKASPVYYTMFNIALPLGMIAGSPITTIGYFKKDRPILISIMILLFSPLIFVLAVSSNPLLDIIDAFAIGLILPIINIPITANLMRIIPQNIYGRVMSFLKIFSSGASPVMGAVFSTLSLFSSIPNILLLVAVLVLPLAVYGMIIIPRFFKIGDHGIHQDLAK
ncbi:MFS transporter [Thermoplasma sp. Kam2015]|uniref:MFS transporter n=1 Tax=Thermoplasma sp. Kam2015 TaxID=2094122 RepID=UPI001379CD04|nr:MFS transporter [Thermoplasma sp. Kam2015]